MTDSKLIGRYVKWLYDSYPCKIGDYTKLTGISSPDCYKTDNYSSLASARIGETVELMPEGFDPNAKIVEPKTKHVPKGTKFDESWIGRQFKCSDFFGRSCSFPYHGVIESRGDFSQFQKEKCVGRYSWNSIIECEDFKWITSTDSSKPPAVTKLLYKRGDILVSLASVTSGCCRTSLNFKFREVGSLHLCHKDVTSAKAIHYTSFGGNETNSDKADEFRLATTEETAFYHKGGRNIKDMPIDKDVNPLKALIVGNWYTSIKWKSGSYAKFVKVHGGQFYYSESIFEGVYKKENSAWFKPDKLSLADMKEVSKYLPDGHPDKIVEPLNPVRDAIITAHDGVKVGEKLDVDVLNAWTKEGNQWSLREGFHESRADFSKICELYVGTITLQGGQHIGHIKHTAYSFKIEGYKKFESDFQKKQVLSSLVPPQPKTTLSEVDYKIGDWLYVLDKFNSCLKIGDVGRICLIGRNGAMLLDVFRVESAAKWLNKNHVRKATTEEIERTLIAEARRRYPIGCTFKCPLITNREALTFDQEYYDNMRVGEDDYSIDWISRGYLYHNGEWSPITSYPDKSIIPQKEQWTNFVDSKVKSQDADTKVHYKQFVYDGKDIIPSFDEEEYKQSSFNQLLQL